MHKILYFCDGHTLIPLNKVTLKYELDLDFILLAITSPLKDYRLCHYINKYTSLNLYKSETEHTVYLGNNNEESHFSRFVYMENDAETEYYVLANRSCEGNFLIPELKTTDYFIVIKNFIDDEDLEALQEGLNAIPEVLVASEISPEKLKSKENLIF